MLKQLGIFTVIMAGMAAPALAAIKTEVTEYTAADGTVMVGYLAYDDAITQPRPGILIVHDWMGPSQFTENRAKQLAAQGYVAFAADIYGKGVRPANAAEAGALAGRYKNDRPLLRERVQAAYTTLTKLPNVDATKIVVTGYCFGGTTALELARSGVALAGTVSFHGGLSNPTPENAKNIHGQVLILHGADDPAVPPAEVTAFGAEMKAAQIPFEFISYPGAVHAFTNPAAGNDNSKGAAYNAAADAASAADFAAFLKRVAP